MRLALTHLVNRERILKEVYHDLGRIVTGPFYIDSSSYDQSIKPWPFDVDKAKALLAEAGWKDTGGDGVLRKDGQEVRVHLHDHLRQQGRRADRRDRARRLRQGRHHREHQPGRVVRLHATPRRARLQRLPARLAARLGGRPVSDLAFLAGRRAERLQSRRVQERRGGQDHRGGPPRVRRGEAHGAVPSPGPPPARGAAVHVPDFARCARGAGQALPERQGLEAHATRCTRTASGCRWSSRSTRNSVRDFARLSTAISTE